MTFFSDLYDRRALALPAAFIVFIAGTILVQAHKPRTPSAPVMVTTTVPTHISITPQEFAADLDVARVFGRSAGCADADSKLIVAVASEALAAGIESKLLAATVAVESACDPMAVSKRGAIGLTQVMPRIWKDKYDFTTINLFNVHDNLHTGALIEAGLVKQYGVTDGIRRYQGTETGCASCDDNYVPKILALAGKR